MVNASNLLYLLQLTLTTQEQKIFMTATEMWDTLDLSFCI